MIANLALLVLAATAPAAPARTLTLDEALATARARQPLIHQAAAGTQAAAARADEALSPLLPQVSGSANYQRATANFTSRPGSLPSQISGGGSAASWNTFNYFNLGLSASQLIYDFGQSRSRWRSSQASAESQRASERTTLDQVLFSVRSSYFQARAARSAVTVAVETLSNQEKHLNQVEGFVEAGTQAEIALAQARTGVANAKVQLINAQNAYETAKAQLNQSMGVEGPTDYDVTDEPQPPVDGEDGTTEVLVGEALKARPEFAAMANQVHAQELTLRAIEGAYGPSLFASTGFTDAGEQASNLTWNWNAAISLSVPIFQGGQTRAQVREAEATLASIRSQVDLERQQVRLEVEQARLAVRAAKEALVASGEALANAREQLRLAEGRYETGIGSIIELSDSQVALTSAGYQRVQAEYSLAQARAGLIKALGRD
jgi:outer membrane protein